MIRVKQSRDAKYYHKNFPDTGCVTVKFDGAGISADTELTVKEAEALRDELTDIIEWIKS